MAGLNSGPRIVNRGETMSQADMKQRMMNQIPKSLQKPVVTAEDEVLITKVKGIQRRKSLENLSDPGYTSKTAQKTVKESPY
jgi:hypothetical protein